MRCFERFFEPLAIFRQRFSPERPFFLTGAKCVNGMEIYDGMYVFPQLSWRVALNEEA
jgi:hypothetical protein